jgi:hypothetical protein
MLGALEQVRTPEQVAAATKLPPFRVRSGLRDLLVAGYVREESSRYETTGQDVARQ